MKNHIKYLMKKLIVQIYKIIQFHPNNLIVNVVLGKLLLPRELSVNFIHHLIKKYSSKEFDLKIQFFITLKNINYN